MPVPFSNELTAYGYRSTFWDPVTLDDSLAWFEELKEIVIPLSEFSQLIDLRQRLRFSGEPDHFAVIQEQMRYVREQGLIRSVVLVTSRQVALKIKQLSFGTPVYEWERYIDGSDPECEQLALGWIERRIDPDRRAPAPTLDAEARGLAG
jgi:hypothetical protein